MRGGRRPTRQSQTARTLEIATAPGGLAMTPIVSILTELSLFSNTNHSPILPKSPTNAKGAAMSCGPPENRILKSRPTVQLWWVGVFHPIVCRLNRRVIYNVKETLSGRKTPFPCENNLQNPLVTTIDRPREGEGRQNGKAMLT